MICSFFIKRLRLTLLFFFIVFGLKGQTQLIDSLRMAMSKKTTVAEQQQLVIRMCEQHYSLSPDSLLKYIKIGEKVFSPNSALYFRIEYFNTIYLLKTGRPRDAAILCDSLLKKIAAIENAESVRMEIISSRCGALIRNSQNKEAIEQSFKLLQLAESNNDTLSTIKAYIYLGWANMELSQNLEAIRWFNIGYHYTTNEKYFPPSSSLFSNIASCYNNINQPDSAFFFIRLALKYTTALQNLSGTANALNIRADMYLKQNNYTQAEADLKAALDMRKQIGDPVYIISDMGQLAYFYASTKQFDKGIAIANEGLLLARKDNNFSKQIFLNNALSENYLQAGRMKEYANTLKAIIDLKDSLYDKNSANAIADFEAKYELQKKENIIIQQQYNLEKNHYLIIGVFIFIVLAFLLAFTLYKNYQHAQQIKMKNAMEEQKILSFKAIKVAEENERKRIAADLHDNLGSYAAAITANVKYLKEGINLNGNAITDQLEENAHSMVTQLSDTIWVLKNEHLLFTKLADRFKVWILRLMQSYPDVKYHYSENIENDVEFTPTHILNVFLILKECVNNALKHSECTDLTIHFLSTEKLLVSIEDNGKGIDSNTPLDGNGIENIKYRAAECGWHVEWQQVNHKGTRVVIMATTTN